MDVDIYIKDTSDFEAPAIHLHTLWPPLILVFQLLSKFSTAKFILHHEEFLRYFDLWFVFDPQSIFESSSDSLSLTAGSLILFIILPD